MKQLSQIHKWETAWKFAELGWETMTWKLPEPSIVKYFFNLASGLESAISSTSISFKKDLGFVFSAYLVPSFENIYNWWN